MLRSRLAEPADVSVIAQLVDETELKLNPAAQPVGEANVLDQLSGYFDQPVAELVFQTNRQEPVAFFILQADKTRQRWYPDIYIRPGFEIHEQVQGMMLSKAVEIHPDWKLWQGINAKDEVMKTTLRNFGFSILRKYWSMERALNKQIKQPKLPDSVEIRVAHAESDFRICHKVQQESFASHFGFTPRTFEEWYRMTVDYESSDKGGVAVLYSDAQPVGFVECSNDNAHFNSGYVNGIGVIPSAQGRGFGELLLRWAMWHSAQLGYDRIELNVDAGNESGALRLYEKTGFQPYLAWEQWHNPNWANEFFSKA